nr:hypothetical protein [Mycobacterium ulcerans]
METFKLDPRDWWIARIVGRNPLLRRADRVEALVVLIALAASLVAIPVAAVLGAVVFNARADQYAEQAQVRHPVTAEVTGTTRNPNTEAVVVQVRWPGAAADTDLARRRRRGRRDHGDPAEHVRRAGSTGGRGPYPARSSA